MAGMFESNIGSGGSGINLSAQPFKFGNSSGGFGGFLDSFNSFMGGDTFKNLSSLGSLGLGAFGLKNSLDIQGQQMDLLQSQENRATTAQNFQTGNSLALQLATTTPGTPEHERIKQAIADGSFAV